MFNIAHIAAISEDRISGPRNSVTRLSQSLDLIDGVNSDVYSTLSKNDFVYNKTDVLSLDSLNKLDNYDLVVFSGFYQLSYLRIGRYLKKKSIPYLLSPRSSLVRSTLKRAFFSKASYMLFGGINFIKNSTSLHFLTESEKLYSLKFGNRSFVCSNIVDSPPPAYSLISPEKNSSSIIIGYLGRYDIYHKGLDNLIEAIYHARDFIEESNIRFRLHGSDHRNGQRRLREIVRRRNLERLVHVGNAFVGKEKWQFMASCDAFIHTSRYEGQPQSVMEAMSYGIPVIVTEGTNMAFEVKQSGAGMVIPIDPQRMFSELDTIVKEVRVDRMMGAAARLFASENYSPEVVSSRFLSHCQEVVSFSDTKREKES